MTNTLNGIVVFWHKALIQIWERRVTKKNVSCYIAQNPVLRTAQSTSYFTSLNSLIEHNLYFSGEHPARRLSIQKCPPLSIARYSFIQLSEQFPHGFTSQHRIKTQVLLVECESLPTEPLSPTG